MVHRWVGFMVNLPLMCTDAEGVGAPPKVHDFVPETGANFAAGASPPNTGDT
jgi:hypothetical protein